jgi:beta-lactamase class D
MIVNKSDDAVLRGKRRYIFATNIEAANIPDPLTARDITGQILHELKLF